MASSDAKAETVSEIPRRGTIPKKTETFENYAAKYAGKAFWQNLKVEYEEVALLSLLAMTFVFAQQPKFDLADVHVSTTAPRFAQNFGGVLREGR